MTIGLMAFQVIFIAEWTPVSATINVANVAFVMYSILMAIQKALLIEVAIAYGARVTLGDVRTRILNM